MKRGLGVLVLVSALTACGGTNSREVADDPGATMSAPATETPTPGSPESQNPESPSSKGSEWTQLRILNLTSAGGEVTGMLHALATPAQVDAFVKQLQGTQARKQVRRAVAAAEVPQGDRLMGSVVALSCEPPTEVAVEFETGRPTITAELPRSNLQCIAAITSVALVSVRADLVPAD